MNQRRQLPPAATPLAGEKSLEETLRALGASRFSLWKLASRYLPHVIRPGEHIGGVVYGRNDQDGAVMLVATDRRVIFLDKKPLFLNEDELTYGVVSGIKYSRAGFGCTVILHTRIKDFVVHTMNKKAARNFMTYVEQRRLETSPEDPL